MKCKRFLAMLCCICIAFCCGTSTSAASPIEVLGSPQVKLSSLTNEECIAYLESVGVTIPNAYGDREINVRLLIEDLENDPDKVFISNWQVNLNFFESVRRAVKEYYAKQYPRYALSGYGYYASGLQNSVLSSWNPTTMPKYNCYAYALGLTDKFYNPGGFYGKALSFDAEVDSLKQLTEGDLKTGWGYCTKVEKANYAQSSLGGWDSVIAVRYGEDSYGFPDFHFTKLLNGKWYHKPGKTAILTFKRAPSKAESWISEGYNGEFVTGDYTYSSDIVFFYINQKHSNETYTGNSYHENGNWHRFEFTTNCSKCGSSDTYWKRLPCSGNPCIDINSVVTPPEVSR